MSKKKTREEFIQDVTEKHGVKYDYSKVEYVNSRTKVCIICPGHGEFWQTPDNHLQGKGCPKCKGDKNREMYASTKKDFIKNAHEKHSNKYDYSKVDYVNAHTKVCIICPEHGEFWQTPNGHLNGRGCSKCANEATGERCRSSLSDFIKKAREKHGNKYDYSKVDYVNSYTKVCIICPEHGEFWQTPTGHLSGRGCSKCGNEFNGECKRLSLSDFIKQARKVHGDKYNYSKVNYVNSVTKVCIICPEHGEFRQTPSSHLSGCGCPKCGFEKISESLSSSKEEFVRKSRKKHGDKYDYFKVDYVGSKTKVCIICPKHGEFWQEANSHIRGQGCPKCKGNKTHEKLTSSKKEFIKTACKVHGDKYDYSKVEYVNAHTKVCIICPEHGEFWQNPNGHLSSKGCLKCGHHIPTTEEWIASARKVHKGKYDYSKVVYAGTHTKVCIICSEHGHGEFWQTPCSHARGNGCPKCNLSHLERSVMNYLDEFGITYDYQKHFDWLGKQSLDFYLPDYNVAIECQGEQHFFPVERFGGDEMFKKILERDKRKKSLCEKYRVKLLYFGNVPNYDTFLGESVHDDVQYLINYLEEHKKINT